MSGSNDTAPVAGVPRVADGPPFPVGQFPAAPEKFSVTRSFSERAGTIHRPF